MSDQLTTPLAQSADLQELLRAIHESLGGSVRELPGRAAVVRAALSTLLAEPDGASIAYLTDVVRRSQQ